MTDSPSSLADRDGWSELDLLLSDYVLPLQKPQHKSLKMAAETITPAAEKTTCAQKNVQSTLPIFKVVKSSAPKKRTRKFLQALQRPKPPPEKIYPVTILANGLVNTGKTPDYLTAA